MLSFECHLFVNPDAMISHVLGTCGLLICAAIAMLTATWDPGPGLWSNPVDGLIRRRVIE